MQRISKMVVLFLFGALTSVCHAATNGSFLCNSKDLKAIDAVSKSYFKDHSAVAIDDLAVASQRCIADHASANIRIKHDTAIQTNVYLKKTHNQWQVLLLGSKFSDDLLAEIPASLREATEGTAAA